MSVLVAIAALSATVAHAQTFTFALNPATKTGAPGSTVIFQGTLANNTAATVYVNSLDIFFTSATQAATIASASPSLALPRQLVSGASYTGDIFQVQIAANENTFPIEGNVAPKGGADTDALNDLVAQAQNFTVAQAVILPESNTLSLAALALPVLGALALRRRRKN